MALPRTLKKGTLASLARVLSHPALGSGVLAFLLYLRTLGPHVFVSDFAEFQYLPAVLGLPHPNGFPLYMLLGWLWSHLPWGNLAWRMNLLSALAGGLAVAITAAFATRLSGRRDVGWWAGGFLALSPTFWGYSLLAERYTLNTALLAAALWLAWEATHAPTEKDIHRRLILSAGLLGLGLDVHPSDALWIPFWFAYLLVRVPHLRRSPRLWAKMILAGGLPLLLYAYVPWRWAVYASWPLLPGIGRSTAVYKGLVHVWYEPPLRWDMVMAYITGLGGYATGLLLGGWKDAIARMPTVWPYWFTDVPWPLGLLSLVGGIRLWRRDRVLTGGLAGFVLFLLLMVAYIQQGKNDAYLLPAFWVACLTAGFAVDWIPRAGPGKWGTSVRWALRGATVILFIALMLLRYPHRDLSRRMDIHDGWLLTLREPVEEGAALLGHWSDLTPLWYMQQAEGRRPDLWGLFPPDMDAIITPWLETGHALYMAAPTHGWAPELPRQYKLMPWGQLVRVLPRDQDFSCFDRLSQTPWTTLSHLTLARPTLPATLDPLEPTGLLFCWRAEHPIPRDTFVGLTLHPTWGGRPVEQTSSLLPSWYPLDQVPAGEEGLALLPLRLPEGTLPGTYQATLHFFRILPDGRTEPLPKPNAVSLGTVQVSPTRTFVRARLGDEVAALVPPRAGPLTLRAWSLSRLPVRPGDPVRLELVWEVRERVTAPLRLQVRFWGRTGRGLLTPPELLAPQEVTQGWEPGTVVRTVHILRAPRGVGDHVYLVEPRVWVGDRQVRWVPTLRWVVGWVRVHDRPHLWSEPEGFRRVEAQFDGFAQLVGYRLARDGQLRVTLLWRATGTVDASYKVFVHLVGPDGQLIAQHDSLPAGDTLPTDVWVPGEYIVDEHPLPVAPDQVPERATLRVGLYDPSTGIRVPVTHADVPVQDNGVILDMGESNE